MPEGQEAASPDGHYIGALVRKEADSVAQSVP